MRAVAILLGAAAILPAATIAETPSIIADSYIREAYADVSCQTFDQKGNGVRIDTVDLSRRKTPYVIDNMTICNAPLDQCASTRDVTLPYWHDEEGGLVISHITSQVFTRKYHGLKLMETYPICGGPDGHGPQFLYEGQCYVGVVSNGNHTVSISYLLGRNVGVDELTGYSKEIATARNILLRTLKLAVDTHEEPGADCLYPFHRRRRTEP
ncbi:hypothetical protein [Cupriavidus campinensis]